MSRPADLRLGGGYAVGWQNGYDEGWVEGRRAAWDEAWAAAVALLPPEYRPRSVYPPVVEDSVIPGAAAGDRPASESRVAAPAGPIPVPAGSSGSSAGSLPPGSIPGPPAVAEAIGRRAGSTLPPGSRLPSPA